MHLTPSIRFALYVALAFLTTQASSQNALEIIPLRHRTVDQVPALRPLMEPGATPTDRVPSSSCASPANLAELRRALEAIDRPARRLQISVRFDEALDSAARDVGRAALQQQPRQPDRGAGADAQRLSAERVDQRVQVLEGGRAFIFTGQSTPIYDGAAMRDTATGFDAIPRRLTGSTVLVEILQRRETRADSRGFRPP